MNRINQSWFLALAMLLPAVAHGQSASGPVKEYVRMGGQTVAVVEWPKQYFPDVVEGDAYYGTVGVLASRGVVKGGVDGNFAPLSALSRAEMAAFLVRSVRSAKGLNPDPQPGEYQTGPYFSDVLTADWYFSYVQTLKEMGLTTGCVTGMYCPGGTVTNPEMATFTGRAIQYLKTGNGMTPVQTVYPNWPQTAPCFTDAVPGTWYFSYVQLAGEMGYLNKICGAGPLPVEGPIPRGETTYYIARGILGERVF